jgi:hypothetical protein
MAAVTIDAGAQNSYYSAGNVGWSARSIFAYRTAIQQLAGASGSRAWGSTTNVQRAQSFTPATAIDVSTILVVIAKAGTPVDNVSLEIWSDTGANLPNANIATSDNVYNGAAISGTLSWLEFNFSTPVSLSSSTKYWMVLQRSGASNDTDRYAVREDDGSLYAGGGVSIYNGSVWGAESATTDFVFQILTETPSALYAVTQSTTPELHVWKSTDSGASWTEQDTANNPSVTNANYPFSACDTRSGPYIGTARFTNTNTIRAALFDMSTDLWGTDLGAADATAAASNERTIRIAIDNAFNTAAPGGQNVWFTSSADDADLLGARRGTSTWTAITSANFLALSSTSASLIGDVVTDKAPLGFQHRIYYNVVDNDYVNRSAIVTTFGTATAIVTDAADVETEHASATYQIYQASNVDKIVAAFINADGSIQERTATLEVTSASVTLGTEHAVGSATTTAGRQLSTCEYDGDLYVMANVSGTGLTYYIDAGAAGSWDSGTSHVSGLTGCTLSQIINVPGTGLGVVYTDNGDAKFDWIIAPITDVTVNGSLATATAAAISALIKPTIQGSLSTSTSAALAGSIVYDINGSLATATALANDGTVLAPQTVNGSLATGDGAAIAGTLVIDIPGSLSTADGAANAGSLIAAMTGSVAAADGAAYSGALKFTFAGSLATATAQANDGSLVVDIIGSTALADAVANDGDVLLGYTVLGSLATADAQANAGTASETGAGDDEPRSGIFQLRPLIPVEA